MRLGRQLRVTGISQGSEADNMHPGSTVCIHIDPRIDLQGKGSASLEALYIPLDSEQALHVAQEILRILETATSPDYDGMGGGKGIEVRIDKQVSSTTTEVPF